MMVFNHMDLELVNLKITVLSSLGLHYTSVPRRPPGAEYSPRLYSLTWYRFIGKRQLNSQIHIWQQAGLTMEI